MSDPHTFANSYEFRCEGGDHTPTDAERAMIEDAICSYLADAGTDAEKLKAAHQIVADLEEDRDRLREFLGKVQGVCMGVAMSGRDHPNPDGALMDLYSEAQSLLFPPAPTNTSGTPIRQKSDVPTDVNDMPEGEKP